MKYLLSFSTFLLCLASASAQTAISGPAVSGHWDMAGSPYIINSDVYIPNGSVLTIDPGVEVKFSGHYRLESSGALKAIGTAAAPITFHAQDTTGWYNDQIPAGGWKGLYFKMFSDGGSILEYCKISDCKYGYDTSMPTSTGTITAYKDFTLRNCDIFHNQCTFPLAAQNIITISQFEVNQVIEGCHIHDNIATYAAVDLSTPAALRVDFKNNEVDHNTCYYPVWMRGGILNVEGNNMHHNTSGMQGGTLTIASDAVATVKNNKIHHNMSETEAALVCVSSTVDINSNLICNNKSLSATCGMVDGGGGIQLSSNGWGTANSFMIRNNVIANNRTEFCGGAIDLINANVEILNNTIVNNSARTGGGIFVMNNGQMVNIKNNILWHNDMNSTYTAAHAPGVYVLNGYEISYNNNYAEQGYSEHFYSLNHYALLGDTMQNVIGFDPLFVAPTTTDAITEDATLADFSLQAASPCINAGDTAGASPYATDYAGNSRITGTRIDIGAYEKGGSGSTASVGAHNAAANNIAIFPVPAHDVVNISLPTENGTIEILDVTGKAVLQQAVSQKISILNVQQLPAGTYMVKWTDAHNKVTTQKMVKG